MTEARQLLPTDVIALVSHDEYDNGAWPRERFGADESSSAPLGLLLDQFVARRRSAWVCVQRQRLQGLVTVRRRGGREAWEVDYLVDATEGNEKLSHLLDAAIVAAGKRGAEKLFLRLESSSDMLPSVLESGFHAYQEEALLTNAGPIDAPRVELRPLAPSDSYLLYRLYSATTPESTRRSEAATFAEWHAAQERQWLKGASEFVYEKDGAVHAAVSIAKGSYGVVIGLQADEAALPDLPGIVVSAGYAVNAHGQPISILLPRAAEPVSHRLADAGFAEQREFVSLVRRTTRVQKLPKLAPAVARNAVGA
ncbi:MAG TPA: hypothetical protein VI759_02555 [Dehalococcoidia bacterium]|nr:hypothetical protein [Dehalococcoidia bacterium]